MGFKIRSIILHILLLGWSLQLITGRQLNLGLCSLASNLNEPNLVFSMFFNKHLPSLFEILDELKIDITVINKS